MADDNVNVNPAAVNDGDDTVTRKTIRLRPMPAAAPRPEAPAAVPAAPKAPAVTAAAADDSGDDTKTRRTIKLKPIAAKTPVSGAVPPPVVKPVQAAPSPVVKPAAVPEPAPAPASVAAPAGNDGEDTVTRKTLVLKPMSASKTTAPAAKPVAPPPAPAISDNTVKLQRPAPKPLTPPPAPKPQAATPPPAPKPLTPPPTPKPLTPPPAPKSLTPPPVATPENAVPEFASGNANSGDSPSMMYLIVAAVSLICLIYSTLLITVQFLDLTQGQKVEEQIPAFILPKAK